MPSPEPSPYSLFFHLVPSSCFLVERGGRITEANTAAIATFGSDPNETAPTELGQLGELVHESDRPGVEALLNAPVHAPPTRPFDVRMRTRAHGYRWFRWNTTPLQQDRLCISAFEIRHAEEELRQSEERFRLLVDTVQDYAIFVLDPDGRVQTWNRGAQALKLYTASEVIGSHFSCFYTPEDIAATKPLRALEIAIQAGRVEDEGWRLRKDGTRFWASVIITRLQDERKQLLGFAKVTRDLTKRREMDEAVRLAHVELETKIQERTKELRETEEKRLKLELQLVESAKMEAIGRLAGGVAHDFNNMLTVISGTTELLQSTADPIPPEMLRESLADIRDAAMRSSDLTRQLLAFSRKQILVPRVFNVNAVVTSMRPMLSRLIGEQIRVITTLDPDLANVTADYSQLEQVVLNLAVNARDAMPGGGELTIETANASFETGAVIDQSDVRPGSYVMLSISDTGTGIDDATRAFIFEPFFTTKRPGQGTGLGLATVHGVVRQSGGFIRVYSDLGRGTSFKIYLPATPAAAVPDRAAIGAAAPASSVAGTILLAEDEPAVRRLARAILVSAGHRVLEAGDGERALALAGETTEHIDLLVTDVVMPGMNGIQLYQKIVAIRPNIGVLYMSGYTQNAVTEHGVLDPDVNFLQKPFTRLALSARVEEQLSKLRDKARGT